MLFPLDLFHTQVKALIRYKFPRILFQRDRDIYFESVMSLYHMVDTCRNPEEYFLRMTTFSKYDGMAKDDLQDIYLTLKRRFINE